MRSGCPDFRPNLVSLFLSFNKLGGVVNFHSTSIREYTDSECKQLRREGRRSREGQVSPPKKKTEWSDINIDLLQRFFLLYASVHMILLYNATIAFSMKQAPRETQTLRAGCSKAEPKIFAPPQTPFPGARDGQNLISWRWSLPLPTRLQTQFGEDRCTQFRVVVARDPQTNKQTHPQTRPITIHCAAKLSAQCNQAIQCR